MKIYVLCRTEHVGEYADENLWDVLDSTTFYTSKEAAEKAKSGVQYVVELNATDAKPKEQAGRRRKSK